ncbi:MAG: NAD(P)-dependent alcohol dehydrogenase, partial [Betaproteobacteria bacterium]|nr:NAD(P)-dependent alcohol dehydrogenase [Betaproteobacteria bacterium]
MSIKTIIVQPGGGFDHVVVGSTEPRQAGPGEVTVRLHASSLNYHDYAVVSGAWGPTAPRIPMSDGAGVVTAVGEGVTGLKVGDHVVSLFFPEWADGEPGINEGSFARVPGDGIDGYAREQVTAAASAFTLAPKGYSHAEAATLTCAGLTAWRALMADDTLKPGDTVLVQGTGGVSIFALQFAKLAGATVIATSSSDAKLERLKALGADHLINYSVDDLRTRIKEITGDKGVDVVYDPIGGPLAEQALRSTAWKGRYLVVGFASGQIPQLPFNLPLLKGCAVMGVFWGSFAEREPAKSIQNLGQLL